MHVPYSISGAATDAGGSPCPWSRRFDAAPTPSLPTVVPSRRPRLGNSPEPIAAADTDPGRRVRWDPRFVFGGITSDYSEGKADGTIIDVQIRASDLHPATMTPGSSVGVRPAEIRDAGFITAMAGRLAESSRLPWLPRQATHEFARAGCQKATAAIGQPGHAVFVAESENGERLGFVHIHLDQSAFTGETVGYVSVVVVTPEAGGSGFGRRLMQTAEEWAKHQGCRLLTLEVLGSNAHARTVYQRLGYREQTLKLAKQLHKPTDTRY